jgi:hypothetical protein
LNLKKDHEKYQRIIVGYTVIIYLYYSSGTKVDNSHKLLVTSSGDPKKDKLLQKAPVVPYGTDLEHWENRDKMETPLVIK